MQCRIIAECPTSSNIAGIAKYATVIQPTPPPMIIQPTASHSDETIRIERDAYKQVVEAHQKTLATIEWAVGIIGSLIIILVGYIVFKNNKEYKDALEQAKEARHWEAEAKQILGSIDKQVKEEIENIKKQGKESIEKIDDKSEKERRVSELWNDAIRLHHEGRYEDVYKNMQNLIRSNLMTLWHTVTGVSLLLTGQSLKATRNSLDKHVKNSSRP